MKTLTNPKTNRLDGYAKEVPQFALFRGDAQAGLYAQHLVIQTLAEVFRHEFEEFKFVNDGLIPWDFSSNDGALSIGWYDLTRTQGLGDGIVSDDAEDVPSVEIAGSLNVNKVVTVAKAFKYSRQDVRTAAMQGLFGLVAEKSMACREAHDQDLNQLIRNGSNDGSIPGLYRHPGIAVVPATTGNWATASAANIEADFAAAISQMMTNNKGLHQPNTALFPIAIWHRVRTLRSSTATDISVLQYLQDKFPEITRWDFEDGLLGQADTGSTTANSVFLYRNDPSVLRAIMPMRLSPLPPQEKGMCVKVIMESRYAGIVVPKPMALCRIDGC